MVGCIWHTYSPSSNVFVLLMIIVSWSQGADDESGDAVRHADTPELAREALVDSAALIFKGQVLFTERTELIAWVKEWPSGTRK